MVEFITKTSGPGLFYMRLLKIISITLGVIGQLMLLIWTWVQAGEVSYLLSCPFSDLHCFPPEEACQAPGTHSG